jgi:tetratricopeptide (TPR) repeat protein
VSEVTEIGFADPTAGSRPDEPATPTRTVATELLKKAVAAHRDGNHDHAERYYRQVLAREPDNAIARNDLGILLLQRGQRERGEELIREAVSLKPDYAEAHCNLGTLLREKGAAEEAIAAFQAAVAAKPGYADAHLSLGLALARKGSVDEALAAFENAIANRPGYIEAQFGRANALKVKGRVADAIAAYREVVAAKPEMAAGHARLGLALWEANEADEAIAAYRRALGLEPQNREALSNFAIALTETGALDAAIAEYRRALAVVPDWAHAHFGLGLALLLNGDYAEGWREYEWRWKGAVAEIKPREMPKPQWQGEDLSGKTLYVYSEQGLGDILQFVRFLPGLAARGARVVLEVPGKLAALLRLAQIGATVVAAGIRLPEFDYHLPLLSLPSVIGLSEAAIPDDIPYLAADPARVASWRQRLPQDGLRVGIAWQGNPQAPVDKGRSIPLAAFAPLAAVPGVRMISLQKNFGLDQLERLPQGMRVETLGAEFDAGPDAFLDAAAVMANLDLVVTSDTSLAHLAGALGRPVWVMLKSNPDWRWLLGREDSPWYPTARLFRQRERGNWGEVLQRVAAELAAVASGDAEKLSARGRAEPPEKLRERAAALFDEGFHLQREGRLEEAAARYAKTITLDPDHAEAYSNLGVIRHGAGLVQEAIALYGRAVALKPAHAPAWGNLAVALAATGNNQQAIAALRQAVAAKPEDAEGHLKLGDFLRRNGDIDGAVAAYRNASALVPDDPKAHFHLGFGLQQKGALDLSIEAYRQAIALAPELAQAHANLGVALLDAERITDGLAACRRAVELAPDNPQYQANLGLAFKKAGEIAAGIERFERAIAIDPRYAEGHVNLALALLEQGKLDGAIEHGRRAVSLKPDYAEAHFNLGLALLLGGDLAAGWPEYEWRWKGGVKELTPRKFKAPQWQGESLTGKTLLLHAEQGLGDTLQFVRFARVAAERGARVVLVAPQELAALLRTVPGLEAVVASGQRLPRSDFHLPLLSLPAVLGTTETTIPKNVPYLSADAARTARWRERLPRDGFKVGIVWQGRPDVKVDKGRSIPLSAFAPLASVPGLHLVSLQKNHGLEQLDTLPEGMRVLTLGADFDAGPDAFLDTAAVMTSLDLVITCDTSAAHLAGALGRPVWVALKHVPDWRWQLERADSPWYPSARLFRQRNPGDWPEVFARIAEEVGRIAAGERKSAAQPVFVPVSVGELVDKITILEIKAERIGDPAKRRNVDRELALLRETRDRQAQIPPLAALTGELKEVNEVLWRIEDDIRECEREGDFGPRFIELARAVYRTNDRRARLKRRIDESSGSAIREEKSYVGY